MTDEHKAALAQGRSEGRAVRDYLESLRANKPRRGRRRTNDSISKRLDAIEYELTTADALTELKLLQERRDLQAELESKSAVTDHAALEKRSSRSPVHTASGRASRTRRGARSASTPPCSARPGSPGVS